MASCHIQTQEVTYESQLPIAWNCITPPHILKKLLESKDEEIRRAALNTLVETCAAPR